LLLVEVQEGEMAERPVLLLMEEELVEAQPVL
jgi:hypothetical protein